MIRHQVSNFGTHIYYTKNWQFNFFKGRNFRHGRKWGVQIKHRVGRQLVRHYSFTVMDYLSRERGIGRIKHIEIEKHLSKSFHGDRVPKSKRYIRLKVCVNDR